MACASTRQACPSALHLPRHMALVDRVAEDPEVINAGQEVEDAQGAVLLVADVTAHVISIDLDPVLLKHEPQILHLGSAVYVKYTVVL